MAGWGGTFCTSKDELNALSKLAALEKKKLTARRFSLKGCFMKPFDHNLNLPGSTPGKGMA